MTSEKNTIPATLATVKHGGCVQLGDWLPPLPHTDYNAYNDGSEPLYTAQQMQDYARAALTDALPDIESWSKGYSSGYARAVSDLAAPQPDTDEQYADEQALIDHLDELMDDGGQGGEKWPPAQAAIAGIIAARQPVGQITDAEIDARLNALYREMVDSGQHNGGMSGVAWDRAVYRMASNQSSGNSGELTVDGACQPVCATVKDSLSVGGGQAVGKIVGYMDPEEDFILPTIDSPVVMGKITLFRSPADKWTKPLYDAPPAQAVDPGPVREALQAAEGLATICASVDGYSREEVAASGRAMRQQFADALAKVDSQAVGNG